MDAMEDLHAMQEIAKKRTKEMFKDRWEMNPKFLAFCKKINTYLTESRIEELAVEAGFEVPRTRRNIDRQNVIPLAVFVTQDSNSYLILSNGKNADPIVMDREGNRRPLGDLEIYTHAGEYTIEVMVRRWLLGY